MLYFLGLGSNDGDRELHLQNALNNLAEVCDNIYSSTHYASPALGEGKAYYLNAVALVDYPGTELELEKSLKHFEVLEGRNAEARAEGRVPLDIDIVIADDKIVRPADYSRFFFKRGFEELSSTLKL